MPSMVVSLDALVDAGPLIAWFDPRDKLHTRMSQFFQTYVGRLYTTWLVFTEVCHFLNVPQQRALIAWFKRGGAQLVALDDAVLDALDALISKYADRPMDIADASLVWLGARMKLTNIITIDREDFSVYRAANGQAFRNLLALT